MCVCVSERIHTPNEGMTVMNTPESNINAKDLALSDHQSLVCKRCLHVKSSFTKSTYKKK